MHNLMRTTLCLLATSLVLFPGASAAGPSLDLGARANVDVEGKLDAAMAAADDAVDGAQSAARAIEARASAEAQGAIDGVEAEASAHVDDGTNAAQRALAGIGAALEAIGDFAAGLFARVDVSARLG